MAWVREMFGKINTFIHHRTSQSLFTRNSFMLLWSLKLSQGGALTSPETCVAIVDKESNSRLERWLGDRRESLECLDSGLWHKPVGSGHPWLWGQCSPLQTAPLLGLADLRNVTSPRSVLESPWMLLCSLAVALWDWVELTELIYANCLDQSLAQSKLSESIK